MQKKVTKRDAQASTTSVSQITTILLHKGMLPKPNTITSLLQNLLIFTYKDPN